MKRKGSREEGRRRRERGGKKEEKEEGRKKKKEGRVENKRNHTIVYSWEGRTNLHNLLGGRVACSTAEANLLQMRAQTDGNHRNCTKSFGSDAG